MSSIEPCRGYLRLPRNSSPRRLALAFVIALLLPACAGSSSGSGPGIPIRIAWTQLGGSGSHNAWGAQIPVPPLKERWFASTSGFFSGPILVGGRIVICSSSGDVEAFNGSGKQVWSYKPDGVPYAPVGLGELVVIPVLLHGDASVVALRAADGSVAWTSPGPGRGANWLWAASDSGTAVVTSSGPAPFLAAWSAEGHQIWSVRLLSSVPGVQDPLRPIAVGSGVVVVLTQGGLEAHALDSGRQIWSDRPASALAGPPTIVDGQVWSDLGKSSLGLFRNRLVGYSLQTGQPTMSRRFGEGLIAFAVDGDRVYTQEGGSGGAIDAAAYRLPSFSLLWRRPVGTLNTGLGSFLPLAGGTLLVALADEGRDLTFHYFASDAKHGWSMHISHSGISGSSETGGELAGLVPTGGGIVLATLDGSLLAFSKG